MKNRSFFYRGYLQAFFFASLIAYIFWFPGGWIEGTKLDTFMDAIGMMTLVAGALMRIWAVSHAGKHTRSRRIKAPALVTTGPYAFTRNPIYLANFLIGWGLVALAGAVVWLPLYVVAFSVLYRAIIDQEESFLRRQFSAKFERYCEQVHRWRPRLAALPGALVMGENFHFKEFGTTFGIVIGAVFIEWIEAPVSRVWIGAVLYWLVDASL